MSIAGLFFIEMSFGALMFDWFFFVFKGKSSASTSDGRAAMGRIRYSH